MKVSIDWLKELVDLNCEIRELVTLLPLRSIGTKEVTDRFIELDMKGYNRSDLLSMRGVAYEVAAITGSSIRFEEAENTLKETGSMSISIEDDRDCPIYCVAQIDGLKVAKSDPSDINKLVDCGIREVNNIADITNLIMLEYGQPLHAFDATRCVMVDGEIQLGVRRAREGEKLETLDGKKRDLGSSDILITSGDRPIGVAGVMGGKSSEISDDTTSIILEAAIFDPERLRQTANRLNIHSEAAKRFYHGLTRKRLMQAFVKAISLYQKMGGEVKAIWVSGSDREEAVKIKIDPEKIRELIGVKLDDEFIIESLKKLYFEVERDDGMLMVTPPYFRLDCRQEVDLVEEVARMYGYEKIPAIALNGRLPERGDQGSFEFEAKLRENLVMIGFNEVLTYSFVGSELIKVLGLDKTKLVKVANPISSETEFMRENIWPNLVEKAVENLKYRKGVRMFEIGKVYQAELGKVNERKVVSMVWADNSEDPLAELGGVVSKLAELMREHWQISQAVWSNKFHPVRQIKITGGRMVGDGGEVNREVVDKLGSNQRVAVIEIKI